MYPAHHMMQHPAAVPAPGPQQQQPRPASTQNAYQGYEATQSPIAYGSPSQQTAPSTVLNRMQKPANTSPTPVQQGWAIGRQVINFDFYTVISWYSSIKVRSLMA